MIILSGMASLHAQDLPDGEHFPVAYGPSNMGREFWLAFPSNWDLPRAAKSYARLYIISHVSTQVKIWAGPTLKQIVRTTPGVAATVELSPAESQMVLRNDQMPVPPDNIYRRRAVHISAGAPIAVYAINNAQYTTEGLLALPTNALGREYIIGSYAGVVGGTQELPSQYLITAPYNGTSVTIYHPLRTPNHAAGETFTIQLDSGDVWSAMSMGYGGDMSGVVIKASKPVAVTAGHMCTYVPNLMTFCCCDHLAEMILPTQAWGKAYKAMHITGKTRGVFYRVFAKEANTTLYINGAEYARLASAGGQEGEGWCEYRAFGPGLQEFAADKPITVFQYNTSGGYDNASSDPFYLQLPPVEQYQKGMTLTVPDKDYTQHFLNIICEKDAFETMEITRVGSGEWNAFPILPNVGVPRPFAHTVEGREYVAVLVQLTPGVYSIRGAAPFGATLHGSAGYETYGYPVSTGARNLSRNDVNAPELDGTQLCDGTVEGRANDLPGLDDLRTNLASIELDPNTSSNYELIVTSFMPGIDAGAGYRLVVVDKTKPAMAIVMAADMAGNVSTEQFVHDPVRAMGLPSSVAPSALNYGKVRMGEKQRSIITITNQADTPGRFDELLLRNGNRNFRIISPTGPVMLGPKGTATASVEVEVEFTAAPGNGAVLIFTDSLGVREECGVRYVAQMQAQVVKPMIRVTDHDFGAVPLQTRTEPWIMEVRNVSPVEGSTLTITEIRRPSSSIFTAACDMTLPFTLEPGESRVCMITAFLQDAAVYDDTLFVISDAVDAGEGDTYGWLRVRGETIASVDDAAAGTMISAMEILLNPAGTQTATLEYSLARRDLAGIELLDMNGRAVRELRPPVMEDAGSYRMPLDLSGLAAGTYFVRIVAGNERRIAHLIITR